MKSRMVNCECCGMEPVAERQNTEIEIVVACCRPMNDNGPDKTIAILYRVVRMVPLKSLAWIVLLVKRASYRCAVLRSFESVNLGSAWYNRAFGKSTYAIHLVGTKLSQSVPVHASSIGLEIAGDCDFDFIAPICFDCLFSSQCHISKI
jgi:hypothetical protein